MIHVVHDVSIATLELPKLFAGEADKPSSGLGSNTTNASIATSGRHPVPKAIIVGGGFTPDEFDELRTISGAGNLPWLRADVSAGGPSSGDEIASRIKKCFAEHDLVPGGDSAKHTGTVWDF